MFFTEKEIQVYGLIQPTEKKIEKARLLYEKLQLGKMTTFKGFYMLWGEEIQKININNVDSLGKLCLKIKRYKKHRMKLAKEGKIARCFNCIWRIPRGEGCRLCKVTDKGLTYLINKNDNDKCIEFIARDIW